MSEIKIDLGATIPFLYDKFLAFIGKDKETEDLREWFAELQRAAIAESSMVQCIGMHQPLPINQIYQPTKLTWQSSVAYMPTSDPERPRRVSLPQGFISPREFLNTPASSIIYAGPGWGKTTFLHHIFMSLLTSRDTLPVLFTLRRPEALSNLFRFVNSLSKVEKITKQPQLILLVDGYDEIGTIDRKRVSDVLLRFTKGDHGRFYLTCRDFYDVYELKVPTIRIAPFDWDDQIRYVSAFSNAYGVPLDATALVQELESRGLDDLLSHPLLLALTCIVKSGPISLISRSVIGLIERAIDSLSFRWDEGKGLAREARLPLDGKDRMKCLMRVAFDAPKPEIAQARAQEVVRQQLDLLRWDDLDPVDVMRETARERISAGQISLRRTLQRPISTGRTWAKQISEGRT